jgi:hypothetical protein
MACSECNDLLVAPASSAYVSNHEVRHVWSCDNCGHEVEMAVTLRFDTMSAPHRFRDMADHRLSSEIPCAYRT